MLSLDVKKCGDSAATPQTACAVDFSFIPLDKFVGSAICRGQILDFESSANANNG